MARDYRYNYDGNNRLTDIKNAAGTTQFAFGYDARGNTTSKSAGANTQARVFDTANRLSQVTGVQTYRYDGLGRRVQTTDADGKTTFWMYSQSGQVLYSSEARRSQNISYLYLGNTQVATRTVAWGTGTTTVRYQHTDALGSPVVETDASRNITDKNVFSPWGEVWGSTVVDGTGFTGHVMDQGTGLTYMQQRYYDPQVGKFLSVDPVATRSTGDNFNRYWYANNNPYRFTDPDGRESACFATGTGCGINEPTEQDRADFEDSAITTAGVVSSLAGGLGIGRAVVTRVLGSMIARQTGSRVVSGLARKAISDNVKGKIRQIVQGGGGKQANREFAKMTRGLKVESRTVQTKQGEQTVRSAELADGSTVSVRSFSGQGSPTIQINNPATDVVTKVRYVDK